MSREGKLRGAQHHGPIGPPFMVFGCMDKMHELWHPMDMSSTKTKSDKTTVIVIDDDAGICDSLTDLLSLENFHCVAAGSGQDGLDLVDSVKPQLVVTDVQLPDISGYQVCQEMKRDPGSRHIPVVMITGRFMEPDDKIQGFESGADEFFAKPFDPFLFVARIKSILRSAPQAA
jgi:two-component system, OmpR family, phosphate regulon response regulator PhoB